MLLKHYYNFCFCELLKINHAVISTMVILLFNLVTLPWKMDVIIYIDIDCYSNCTIDKSNCKSRSNRRKNVELKLVNDRIMSTIFLLN